VAHFRLKKVGHYGPVFVAKIHWGRRVVMASLVKKLIKGRPYYYVVESARINGQPRVVNQTYLGSLDHIVTSCQRNKEAGVQAPDYANVLEFGAVSALFDLAERLGVRQIIDERVKKRRLGLPVGDYLVLAAIHRAVEPASENVFGEDWLKRTVLTNSFRLTNQKNLSSQDFWNNPPLIDRETITNIEDVISSRIVKLYNITTECLLFDNSNFVNYINTHIVSFYRSRYNVEECLKQVKTNDLLSFIPINHFSNNNITIYAFYCVLALTLTSVLKLELKNLGCDYTIDNILKIFSAAKQIVNIYSHTINHNIVKTTTFTKFNDFVKKYCAIYNLYKYVYKIN
jgi:transposase